MSIEKTEAVILADMPQGETSKIIRIYSRDAGRLSLIAKGVRTPKNRFGGALEPLNHVQVVYYFKDNRDLHILSQCDVINAYPAIRKDLDRLAAGLACAEIIVRLVVEEEPNPELFDLLTGTLEALEKSGTTGRFRQKNVLNYYWYFLTRFLEISGFGLSGIECSECGSVLSGKGNSFSVSRGGFCCGNCQAQSIEADSTPVSAETVQVIRHLLSKSPAALGNLSVSTRAAREIETLLDKYCRYHFEGYMPPKSLGLMSGK
jgi:DNA repair protein RecO (recombination protein O)